MFKGESVTSFLLPLKKKCILFLFSCRCVWACAHESEYLLRPERSVQSPGARVTHRQL